MFLKTQKQTTKNVVDTTFNKSVDAKAEKLIQKVDTSSSQVTKLIGVCSEDTDITVVLHPQYWFNPQSPILIQKEKTITPQMICKNGSLIPGEFMKY